jgi:PKD repeat protein
VAGNFIGTNVTGTVLPFQSSTSANALTPTHVFTTTGTYSVTFTVRDNQGGVSSVTHQVVITAVALQADPCDNGSFKKPPRALVRVPFVVSWGGVKGSSDTAPSFLRAKTRANSVGKDNARKEIRRTWTTSTRTST